MSNENQVYSRQALDFFTVSNEYCLFIERAEKYSKDEIFDYLAKVMPLLYLKGYLLPAIEPEYPEANERYVTEEQWDNVFSSLRSIFGDGDEFVLADPYDHEHPPVKYSLAEQLADIYQDMKDFTLLFGKESHAAKENALCEAHNLFRTHWGQRVVRSHYYIHHFVFRKGIETDLQGDWF